MRRRRFISLLGLGLVPWLTAARLRAEAFDLTLLTAPVELGGDWGESARRDVAVVISRTRTACLSGVELRSDRQPAMLRVDHRPGGPPSVWLQTAAPTTAWVNVSIGARDWCNLAYQFGHELGHVLCNSWAPDAKPRNPCQWIEEALVEAFSLRGLAILADQWAHAPPFPRDEDYADSIRDYRETILARSRAVARDQGIAAGFSAWFKAHESVLGRDGGVDAARGAVPTMLDLLMADATAVEDLGALNRWLGRSGVPLSDYLALWENSCTELNAPGRLPIQIRSILANA
jgi:hypothetical protein